MYCRLLPHTKVGAPCEKIRPAKKMSTTFRSQALHPEVCLHFYNTKNESMYREVHTDVQGVCNDMCIFTVEQQ